MDAYTSQILPTAMTLDTHNLFQTIAAVELYRAQREVAHYLEWAYLHLADHPDVAKEVRLTAHAARSQHVMTSGLMKKFMVTSAHIVNTMIPMVLDAVELHDKEIIEIAFCQIITMAEDMKKEAEETKARYLKIQGELQSNMASMNKRNVEVLDNQKRIAIEMKTQKRLEKLAKIEQQELEEEKRKMEEELAAVKANRDKWMETADKVANEMSKDAETFLDHVLPPPASMVGGKIALAMGIVQAGINIFKGLFGANRTEKKHKEVMDTFKETQKAVERILTSRQGIVTRQQQKRAEALKRLANLKILAIKHVDFGNVESLREASLHLGQVDQQFTRIILFWENMAATLKYLKDDVRAGEVFLRKLEIPKFTMRFKSSVARVEKGWMFFGRICSDYVQETDTEIFHLYQFLSDPVDSMSVCGRKERQKALMAQIEDDIDNAYPSDTSEPSDDVDNDFPSEDMDDVSQSDSSSPCK